MATRPHSEHSLRAMSNLFNIADVMENMAESEVESDG